MVFRVLTANEEKEWREEALKDFKRNKIKNKIKKSKKRVKWVLDISELKLENNNFLIFFWLKKKTY